MNLQNMMMQARKMQKDIEKTKKELESKTYDGSSQFVTATIYGNGKLKSININMEELENDDKDMLEDLMMIAINQGISQVEKEKEDNMKSLTGGLDLSSFKIGRAHV